MRRTSLLVLILSAVAVVAAACGGGGTSSTPTTTPSPTDTATTSEPASSTPALVARLRPSVVHILSEAATLDVFGQLVPSQGVGTGFIVDEEGFIVTNNHVITMDTDQPAERITVTLSDGSEHRAEIVGRDPPTDLAVLKIDADGLSPVELGNSSRLQVGEEVVAIGNAFNLPGGPTVTKGVVSAQGRLIQEQQGLITIPDAIQTDAAINPGNSGGPLVNMSGQVVGITTAIIGGAEGIGLAISIDLAEPIIAELIDEGRVDRGLLGVAIVPITPALAASLDLDIDHGVGLRDVQQNGPADRAGLEPGDIITRLDNTEIRNTGDLFRALTDYRAGETVEVEYYRDGGRSTTQVTLG